MAEAVFIIACPGKKGKKPPAAGRKITRKRGFCNRGSAEFPREAARREYGGGRFSLIFNLGTPVSAASLRKKNTPLPVAKRGGL